MIRTALAILILFTTNHERTMETRYVIVDGRTYPVAGKRSKSGGRTWTRLT